MFRQCIAMMNDDDMDAQAVDAYSGIPRQNLTGRCRSHTTQKMRKNKWQMMINQKLNNKLVHMIYPTSSTDKKYFAKDLTKNFNLRPT